MAVQTIGTMDVHWVVWMVVHSAFCWGSRSVVNWVVNLAGPKAEHSAALWVIYWVAKMAGLSVPLLGHWRVEQLEHN